MMDQFPGRFPQEEAAVMKTKKTFKPEELRYLQLLAKQYPTIQAAST